MNRRQLISGAATLLGAGLVSKAGAQSSSALDDLAQSTVPAADKLPYTPVITPNGRTLVPIVPTRVLWSTSIYGP